MKRLVYLLVLLFAIGLNAVVPDYLFETAPEDLLRTYYDYMPGSYNGFPIRVQPDEFGGVYMVFHAREDDASNRKMYYVYIDASGEISEAAYLYENDVWTGYGTIAIDPITGDPFAAWHGSFGITGNYAYSNFDNWVESFTIIDRNSVPGVSDETLWPYVQIGQSPVAGKRRLYVQAAMTGMGSTAPQDLPIIAYTDFDADDFDGEDITDWNYITIPIFEEIYEEDEEIRIS